jgi:two-component system phosphate regulon sensor histidine kinase PhoR
MGVMWRSWMFWRLFALYAGVSLGAIALLGIVVEFQVERYLEQQVEEILQTRAILVEEAVRGRPIEPRGDLQARTVALAREIATRITLLDRDGVVLADSDEDPAQMENHAGRPEVQAARAGRFGSASRFSTTVNQWMLYLALRADGAGPGVAFVRVALPLTRVQAQVTALRRLVLTAAGLTGLAILALSFYGARSVGRPLREIARGAERLAGGEYGHKVYALGRDDIGQLGRAFNHMSDRLKAQFVQLEEDRQQLRTILSGMVEGVIALDAEQRVLFANDRAAQLLEFPPRAGAGRKLWEVVRNRALQQVVRHALAGAEPVREELNWDRPDRRLTVHAARLPGQPPRGAVLVLHDTTELRRLERLRQDFVANVSHELKTPLSVIKACVETLLDGAQEDAQHRGGFLQQIDDQAERLHALILDLLSLARIESGDEAFEMQAVDLDAVVAACLERQRRRAEGKKQTLEAVPAADGSGSGTPVCAWADEEAVSQIVENLVDNAVKYTPEGGRIWVRWGAEDGQVRLEVEDTGIGIPQQDLPRIFERFYRVDKARSRELGGTGLGLSIVKHLVQAMHGSVTAASRLGHGTTFTVRLPRAAAT